MKRAANGAAGNNASAEIIENELVKSSVWRTCNRVCNAALTSKTVARIYGDSQIGKTRALEEYARRNNHGQTKYIRMPASAGVQLFMKEVARACYVSPHLSFEGMKERVLSVIDDTTLVIFDEFHQAFLYQQGDTIKVVDVIREIYDRTQCGMVLCGTSTFKREFNGGKMAPMLEQLRRRGNIEVDLKTVSLRKGRRVVPGRRKACSVAVCGCGKVRKGRGAGARRK